MLNEESKKKWMKWHKPLMLTEKQQRRILDSLWVVAENQLGGWCACDSIGGDLITYETYEEAQKEAEAVIKDLNECSETELEDGEVSYDEDSWGAKRLSEVTIGDNQERVIFISPIEEYLGELRQVESWCCNKVFATFYQQSENKGALLTIEEMKLHFPIQRIDG